MSRTWSPRSVGLRELRLAAMAVLFLAFGLSPPAGADDPAVTPPRVVDRVEAVYPAEALAARKQADVILEITVEASGRVADATVARSGGAEFDEASLAAVRRWQFSPATDHGLAVPARIRIPFQFRVPESPSSPPGPAESPPPASAAVPAASAPTVTGGTAAPRTAEAAAPEDSAKEGALNATVRGMARARSRGSSDYEIGIGELQIIPWQSAEAMLRLAPGILLTNAGGEGHANQVFLRGFDAREGQDIEFTVSGVPVNQVGSLHGNGYADTNFVIPEVVSSLRVLEGPYAPQQGNFAVAGSADYELGLAERGVGLQAGYGDYGTLRLLGLYGPPGASTHTFAAVELYQTDGFGQNRDAKRGSAIAQYEGHLGSDTTYLLQAQGYAATWHQAGVIREDDYQSGRVGFYDTYDPRQGGDASRFSLSGQIESRSGGVTYRNQAFFILSNSRIRENFTGFLLDPQEPQQQLHVQRGDLIDQTTSATTLGLKGFARSGFDAFGLRQEFEVGYYGRYDIADGTQYRVEAATNAPYHLDLSFLSHLGDIGLYGDVSLAFTSWLTLRAGLRADLFTFDVLNRCAVQSVAHPSPVNPPGDQSCISQEAFGAYREPVQSAITSAVAILPRATLLVNPFSDLTLSASYGKGVRSIDPQYVTSDVKTPFASASSVDLGASYTRDWSGTTVGLRTGVFGTRVDQDLVFSESAGRNVLGGPSTRLGWVTSARVTGSWFDESASVTLVRATFDDTGLLIPYIPDLVIQSNTAVWSALPWKLGNTVPSVQGGLGITYVGPRPLPFGERSDSVFTIDASAAVSWSVLRLMIAVTNLLDTQYRLGEYNYASDFHSQPSPTLVPERTFTAGAPRQWMLSLRVTVGGSP